MSAPISPMGEYVVVVTETTSKKTTSGLYLPESATEKSTSAKVVAVGKDVKEVKVGDKVIYKNDYESTKVKVDGDEYIVVYVKNIIATVK